MKKVLIVDDEFLVRLGLKTTLNWNEYGYEIIGEASSAEEALNIFENNQIDILMTDIKMPGMDGLELIEIVKNRYPQVQVVILSNYDDFNFARKAVNLGASQYILKTEITAKSLIQTLHKLAVNTNPIELSEESTGQMEEKYITDQLLRLHLESDAKTTGLLSKEMFKYPHYVVATFFCGTSSLSKSSITMLLQTITTLIKKLFQNSTLHFIKFKEHSYFAVIIPFSVIQEKLFDTIVERCHMLGRNTNQYFDVSFYFGISDLGNRDNLTELFTQADLARKTCFFNNEVITIYNKSLLDHKGNEPKVSHTKIRNLISQPQIEDLQQYITNIFNELKHIQNYKYVKNIYIDFLSNAKSLCENQNADNPDDNLPIKIRYDNLESIPLIDNVMQYILNLYENIWNLIHNGKNSYSGVIKNCINFIEENFDKNITLEEAAATVSISSSYLSLIFKQETGINFNNYLTTYRIEKSKKLILSSNYKIYEIAEKVGFTSPYYFSKVFKDITKMTCKEFKSINTEYNPTL